jgi:hypothetical protein
MKLKPAASAWVRAFPGSTASARLYCRPATSNWPSRASARPSVRQDLRRARKLLCQRRRHVEGLVGASHVEKALRVRGLIARLVGMGEGGGAQLLCFGLVRLALLDRLLDLGRRFGGLTGARRGALAGGRGRSGVRRGRPRRRGSRGRGGRRRSLGRLRGGDVRGLRGHEQKEHAHHATEERDERAGARKTGRRAVHEGNDYTAASRTCPLLRRGRIPVRASPS